MDVFSALADPTRRKIIEMLASHGQLSATEISDNFSVTPPAISQHLKILRETNVVRVEKRAQQRLYQINPTAMQELEDWARKMTRLWNQRFDALEQVLAEEKNRAGAGDGERIGEMADQDRPELTITRVFDAPRELVFKAWTDPRILAQWWGPKGFTNPVCELDVRPGGAILIHMRAPDGTVFPNKGVFHEVTPPERLVFSTYAFEDENGNPGLEDFNTVTFTEQGGKTTVTLHSVVVKSSPEFAEALAGMKEGWNEALDRLAEQLVSLKQ